MNNTKVSNEISKTIQITTIAMSFMTSIVIIFTFLLLKGNQFGSIESKFNSIVNKNSSYISNEIFLEQRDALNLRILQIIDNIIDDYPGTSICIEINSIHSKGKFPKRIAYQCNKNLVGVELDHWGEVKLGANLIGNIKYSLKASSLLTNKIFHFLILSILTGIFFSILTQFFITRKLTKSFLIPIIEDELITKTRIAKYSIMRQLIHDAEGPIVVLENILSEENLTIQEKNIGQKAVERIRAVNRAALKGSELVSEKEFVQIDTLIKSIISEKEIQYKNDYNTLIKLELNTSRLLVEAEKLNLMRAMSNLIDNAFHAIGTKKRGEILITVSQIEKSYLDIKIQDDGIGIPKEILIKIRKKPFSYKKSQGHGLGLRNAIQIFENHGASVTINSEETIGSIIIIKYPLSNE